MDNHKAGDLYKVLEIEGKLFEIYFGYFSEEERGKWPPTPLFPDFSEHPLYTDAGRPYVTAPQDICSFYKAKPTASGEEWCNDCTYFDLAEEIIGICNCEERKIRIDE